MRDGMPLALARLPWMADGPAGAVIGSRSHVKNQTSKRRRLFEHPKDLSSARELRSLYFPFLFPSAGISPYISTRISSMTCRDLSFHFSFSLAVTRSKWVTGFRAKEERKKKEGARCHAVIAVWW